MHLQLFLNVVAALFPKGFKRMSKMAAALAMAAALSAVAYAQAPNRMSYQAVIRDAQGQLVTEKPVGVRISVLRGSASGTTVYSETHRPTTNAHGLVSLQVGGGENPSGSFSGIDWGADAHFIRTEVDPGGTSYTASGTSQLLSVPYAFYAANGGSAAKGDPGKSAFQIWKEADPGRAASTEADFLAALRGEQGEAGTAAAKGDPGKSAFQIWKEADPGRAASTEADFLAALRGEQGEAGGAGKNAFQIWKEADPGRAASTEADFLAALRGDQGVPGANSGSVVNYSATANSGMVVDNDNQTLRLKTNARKGLQLTHDGLEVKLAQNSGLTFESGGLKVSHQNAAPSSSPGGSSGGMNTGSSRYPVITIDRITPVCAGLLTNNAYQNSYGGGAEITVTGGTPPYQYIWSVHPAYGHYFSTNKDLTDARGTPSYYISVIDANGYHGALEGSKHNPNSQAPKNSVFIPVYRPSVKITATQACWSDGTLSAEIPGHMSGGPFTYQWYKGSDLIATEARATGLKAGGYSLVVTNAAGCRSEAFQALVPLYRPSVKITATQACGSDGTLSAEISGHVSGGPFTYQWYKGSDLIATEARATGLKAGRYSLVVTNAAGCRSEAFQASVTSRFQPTVQQDASCSNVIDISVSGYNGNMTYEWATDRAFTNVVARTQDYPEAQVGRIYYLRITSAEGCKSKYKSFRYSPPEWDVTPKVLLTCDRKWEVAVPGYLGRFTYELADDDDFEAIIQERDLTEGDRYYVRVVNEQGCKSDDVAFYYSRRWEVTPQVSVACNGNLSVTANGRAVNRYELARGSYSKTIVQTSDLTEGNIYYVRAINGGDCKSAWHGFKYSATNPFVSVNSDVVSPCRNESNGSISLTVSGYTGAGNLTYRWSRTEDDFSSPFATTKDVSNLQMGTYYLKITSPSGCSTVRTFHVGRFSISFSANITAPTSSSVADGNINIALPDGNYTYTWADNPQFNNPITTTQNLSNVRAGTYCLRITQTDGNRCSVVKDFDLRASN